jgi:hypothetical protein
MGMGLLRMKMLPTDLMWYSLQELCELDPVPEPSIATIDSTVVPWIPL